MPRCSVAQLTHNFVSVLRKFTGEPLSCDCSLKEFLEWSAEKQVKLQGTCSNGQQISELSPEQIPCGECIYTSITNRTHLSGAITFRFHLNRKHTLVALTLLRKEIRHFFFVLQTSCFGNEGLVSMI